MRQFADMRDAGKPGEVIGLQYLRGIAALSVVIYHFVEYVDPTPADQLYWKALLAAGVDVFFVISGYIIWLTTLKPDLQPVDWLKSRAIRIVPLYWLALIVTLLVGAVTAESYTLDETIRSFLFIPVNSTHGHFEPILKPGWTLNYEFEFYLLTAALLFLPRAGWRLAILVAIFGALSALRRHANVDDAIQFRLTSPMPFEFVAGIVISIVTRHIRTWRTKPLLGAASLLGAALFVVVISPRLHPNGPRVVYFGIPAALLVFGLVCLEDLIRRHVVRPLKFLGDSSYSLYLSHMLTVKPLLVALGIIGIAAPGFVFVAAVLFTTVAGGLIYVTVERPLLLGLRGRFLPDRRVPSLPQGAEAGSV